MIIILLAAVLAVTAGGAPAGADGNEAPGNPAAFQALTGGSYHTCAIVGGGDVKCWGYNATGQLGLGDTDNRGDDTAEMGDDLPTVDLGTGRTATAIIGGYDNTCAILDGGDVKCWGSNTFAQLGLGDHDDRGDETGEMGDNLPTVDLGTGRTATAIAADDLFTCALLDNGAVKCWGNNAFGQLGLGDTARRGDGAGEMGDSLPAVDLGTGRTATAITTGSNHTCALLDNSTVKCWGAGSVGSLGQGSGNNRGDGPGEMGDSLATTNLGTGRTATVLTAGQGHTCAVLDNAALKCWGTNESGQLGQDDAFNRGTAANEMGDNLPPIDLGGGGPADTTDPTVTIVTPPDDATYTRGQGVTIDFTCDDDVAVASCNGDLNDGDLLYTLVAGDFIFTVTATDTSGNTTSVTHNYSVEPQTCDGEPVTVDLALGDVPTAGDDVILGTPDADTIDSLGGNDRICGRGGADTINAGSGNDRVYGQGGDDTLLGQRGIDILDGGNQNDTASGGSGNDTVRGANGGDTLNGLGGADTLDGGAGNDHLNGGAQRDSCYGRTGQDTQTGCELRSGIP